MTDAIDKFQIENAYTELSERMAQLKDNLDREWYDLAHIKIHFLKESLDQIEEHIVNELKK